MRWPAVSLARVVALLCLLGASFAQVALESDERGAVEGSMESVPASVTVSLQAGLPAYRSFGVAAAVKADQFGAELRGGWGSVGLAFGAQLRWYPPVPSPIPIYLGLGADAYEGGFTPFGVLGATVPLGRDVRLGLEVGAARPSLAGERIWAPHLSFGLGYAFSFDVAAVGTAAEPNGPGSRDGASSREGAVCVPGEADPERLQAAVDAAVRAFVRDGVALYGSSYRELRYRYWVVQSNVDGDSAEVRIRYEGSARAVLGGQLVEASGTAHATFRWSGCRWRQTALSY